MGFRKKEIIDLTKYSSLPYEELSQISRNDHQEDTKQYDKQQNSLCLVVLGAIAVAIGILFFILSFKREMNKTGILDVKSLQFLISMIMFGVGAVLLSIGIFFFTKALIKRLQLKDEILAVSLLKKDMMAKIE